MWIIVTQHGSSHLESMQNIFVGNYLPLWQSAPFWNNLYAIQKVVSHEENITTHKQGLWSILFLANINIIITYHHVEYCRSNVQFMHHVTPMFPIRKQIRFIIGNLLFWKPTLTTFSLHLAFTLQNFFYEIFGKFLFLIAY